MHMFFVHACKSLTDAFERFQQHGTYQTMQVPILIQQFCATPNTKSTHNTPSSLCFSALAN